ncbi:MAG: alpha-amylase [Paludibacter sp.]|nr:alpha-amylase [Bacteroidales bacterium]MCM1069232.1 alpha-amylase [Prevotella sp.]MCM1354348.1 alpha-amylase [Bacteroides sp.]MCM1443192.1 alpha-amylase [Muribaculum sp.]MCM1481787.1 alpha-amylase [Paludibacter sp.]
MKNLCLCFQMHAPYRLKRYRFFEIGQDHYYYDDLQTEDNITWLVQTSYMPLCRTLKEMIQFSNCKFRCAISLSGILLEMFEQFSPEMIDLLKELADTKCVEFLATPYAYSLAAEYNHNEFEEQLNKQAQLIKELFGQKPTSVWNTELLYSDEIADTLVKAGYKTVLTEGAKHILSWKSPNYLYHSAPSTRLKVLLRNTNLSDELAFHFSDPNWHRYPIDAPKFAQAISQLPQEEPIVNIWMGAETFGIRQHANTGIFDFLKALPYYMLENNCGFLTPQEAGKQLTAVDTVSVPYPLTWTGEAKDLAAANGNDLQQEALSKLYAVTERVHLCKDKNLKHDWLLLQAIDHLNFMNHIDAGATNYESAYEAFTNYMNVLADFLQLVDEQYPTTIENEELNGLLTTINNQEKEIAQLENEIKKLRKKKA